MFDEWPNIVATGQLPEFLVVILCLLDSASKIHDTTLVNRSLTRTACISRSLSPISEELFSELSLSSTSY